MVMFAKWFSEESGPFISVCVIIITAINTVEVYIKKSFPVPAL